MIKKYLSKRKNQRKFSYSLKIPPKSLKIVLKSRAEPSNFPKGDNRGKNIKKTFKITYIQ